MFISISYFCKFYKSTYVLLENSVHLLVGVKSKDTTKPKFRRRKDLLLLAASKEDTEVCHKQCCSLQHRTLLLSPVTSTVGFCFCFGSIPSLFLEFFLHWSPVAYWAPTDLGSFSFSILSFCLFILFMGFSRQESCSGLPFPSPVDHILSDLSTMTCLSWVALQGMA